MTENQEVYFTSEALQALDKHFVDQRTALIRDLARTSDGLVDLAALELHIAGRYSSDTALTLTTEPDVLPEFHIRRSDFRPQGAWRSYRNLMLRPYFILGFSAFAAILGTLSVAGTWGNTSTAPEPVRLTILAVGILYVIFGVVLFVYGLTRRRHVARKYEKWVQSGALIDSWLSIETALRHLGNRYALEGSSDLPIGSLLRRLHNADALPEALDLQISQILHVRNQVAHGEIISVNDLISANRAAEVVRNRVENVIASGRRRYS